LADKNDFSIEVDWFDDYLKRELELKTSSRKHLRENGTGWDIFEHSESNRLSTINLYGFDSSVIAKFRQVFNGKCRLYELDDAMINFSLFAIESAAEKSGYKKLISLAIDMSDYVEIYSGLEECKIGDGFASTNDRRITLNVRLPTKAEFETISTDLMLDKSSLARTCYWYAVISTKHIAENTQWVYDKLYKNDEIKNITFTCKHILPYSILLNDFKSKKMSIKTLVFRWMSLILKRYRVSLYDYLEGDASQRNMVAIVNMYSILRRALLLSGRRKDENLRARLNRDKKNIDIIKKELKAND
jgi:hypothetical protein